MKDLSRSKTFCRLTDNAYEGICSSVSFSCMHSQLSERSNSQQQHGVWSTSKESAEKVDVNTNTKISEILDINFVKLISNITKKNESEF